MKELLYITDLYDCYKLILTIKEQNCFEDYYFNNLSLSEIAANNQVTRSAVHKRLKTIISKLNKYEKSLRCHQKDEAIKKVMLSLTDEEVKDKLAKIIIR